MANEPSTSKRTRLECLAHTTRFSDLPDEITSREIMWHLATADLFNLRAVSRRFERLFHMNTTLAKTLTTVFDCVNITPKSPVFSCIANVAMRDDQIYLVDYTKGFICKVDSKTSEATVLLGNPEEEELQRKHYYDELAKLFHPSKIIIHCNKILIADTCHNTIREVNLHTNFVRTIAGKANLTGRDRGADACLQFPWGICYDCQGNLLICDAGNHCIRSLTPDGSVTTFAGKKDREPAVPRDGSLKEARFLEPRDIVGNGNGDLFLIDGHWKTIRKISNGVVSTVYKHTSVVYSLALSKNGDIYFGATDGIWHIFLNKKIRVVKVRVQPELKFVQAIHIKDQVLYAGTINSLYRIDLR